MQYQDTQESYPEVACGYYKCFVNGAERTTSKQGKPMLKVSLRIAKACDDANSVYEGRYMWVYQMTTSDYGEQAAREWERIFTTFPKTPIKVSKFMKKSKSGNEFVNYKPWLTDKQAEKLNN